MIFCTIDELEYLDDDELFTVHFNCEIWNGEQWVRVRRFMAVGDWWSVSLTVPSAPLLIEKGKGQVCLSWKRKQIGE